MQKSKLKLLIKIIISLALITFIIIKIKPTQILTALKIIKPIYYLLFFIPFPMIVLYNSISFYFLFQQINVKISLKDLFKFKLVSRAFSVFFLGQFGEASIAPILKSQEIDISMGKSLALVTIDKIISLIVVTISSSYILTLHFSEFSFLKVFVTIISIITLFIILVSSEKFWLFLKDKFLKNKNHLFEGYRKSIFEILRKGKKAIVIDIVMTLLWLSSYAYIINIFFSSFDTSVNILKIASILAASSVISLLPISLSGAGVRESVLIFLFTKTGIDPTISTAIFLTSLLFTYLYSVIIITLSSDHFNLKNIRKISKKSKNS
jgi:glycosyltransferase 2 family protein